MNGQFFQEATQDTKSPLPVVAVTLFGDAPQWMIDAWVTAWKQSGNTNEVVGITHPLFPLKAKWPYPLLTTSDEVLPEWDRMNHATSVKLATFSAGLKARAYATIGRPCWALDLDAVVVGPLNEDFGTTPVAMVRDLDDGKYRGWPEVTHEMNGGVCYQNHRDIWKLFRAYWMLTLPRTTLRHCLDQYVWGLVLGNLGGTELSTDYNLQIGSATPTTKIVHYHGPRRDAMRSHLGKAIGSQPPIRHSPARRDDGGPRLFLATPCYHADVSFNYLTSMLTEIPKLVEAGIEVKLQFTIGDAVNRQRNMLAAKFLASDCSHLLFIDSDTGWHADDILRMLGANKPVMVVNYPKRAYDWDAARGTTTEEVRDSVLLGTVSPLASRLADPTGNEPFEVAYGGTGLMLIQRTVFETILTAGLVDKLSGQGNYRFFRFTLTEAGEDRGEDYAFCDLTRAAGLSVWCDPLARATHQGLHVFEGWPALAKPTALPFTLSEPTTTTPPPSRLNGTLANTQEKTHE